MTDLMQDVTLTLNLSTMTPTKYKEIISMLDAISEDTLTTHTYSNEMPDGLSEEHRELLKQYR